MNFLCIKFLIRFSCRRASGLNRFHLGFRKFHSHAFCRLSSILRKNYDSRQYEWSNIMSYNALVFAFFQSYPHFLSFYRLVRYLANDSARECPCFTKVAFLLILLAR